jgi:hypothetical protein
MVAGGKGGTSGIITSRTTRMIMFGVPGRITSNSNDSPRTVPYNAAEMSKKLEYFTALIETITSPTLSPDISACFWSCKAVIFAPTPAEL